jgi:hypothetical protein
MDWPALNGDPNALAFVTPNWNPGGSGGVYDNSPLAVAYLFGQWCIVNENSAAMPIGATFNVMAGAQQLELSG